MHCSGSCAAAAQPLQWIWQLRGGGGREAHPLLRLGRGLISPRVIFQLFLLLLLLLLLLCPIPALACLPPAFLRCAAGLLLLLPRRAGSGCAAGAASTTGGGVGGCHVTGRGRLAGLLVLLGLRLLLWGLLGRRAVGRLAPDGGLGRAGLGGGRVGDVVGGEGGSQAGAALAEAVGFVERRGLAAAGGSGCREGGGVRTGSVGGRGALPYC